MTGADRGESDICRPQGNSPSHNFPVFVQKNTGRLESTMESKNRGIQPQPASTHMLQSFDFSPSTAGFMGSEFERSHGVPFQDYHLQPQSHPRPPPPPPPPPYSFALPQSYEIKEAIRREIENPKIRDQMIIDEIVRRRMIESEVRRELMQRELALRQGSNGFSISLPAAIGFDLAARLPTMPSGAEGSFLDQRSMLRHSERESFNGRFENGWHHTLPFQRGTTNVRTAEMKPVLEGGKEKERIILLPKINDVSGSKRKAVATPSPAVGTGEIPSVDISRKKAREEWSCALCKVSATSEQGLNDHLEGKKHKAKEAKLKTKAAKKHLREPIKVEGLVGPGTEDGLKATSESLSSQKAGEASSEMNVEGMLLKNFCSDGLNEYHLTVVETVQQSDDPKKENFKFWCDICRVGTHSKKVMDDHKNGRKHVIQLWKSSQNSGANSSEQYGKIMNHEGVAEDSKNIASEKVGNVSVSVSDESRSPEHMPTDAIEPEDREAVDENDANPSEADGDIAKPDNNVSTLHNALNASEDELTVS